MSARCSDCEYGECSRCAMERVRRATHRDLLLELAEAIIDMAGELNMDAKVDGVRKLAAKVRETP